VILPADEVIDPKPSRCGRCEAILEGDDPEPIVDQVIDLPVVMRRVVHHRRHRLTCSGCGAATIAADVPEARIGFGPRLQAAVAYLGGVGRLGKRPIRALLADLCGIPIALGSVSRLEARTSHALAPVHAEALQHIRGRDANVDETGWREGGQKAWLWAAVTEAATVFLIRKHRNRAALDDLVGPSPGVLTTDRYSVYAHLPSEKRQVCWAHLRRDFQAMIDRKDAGSAIGEELLLHATILLEKWRQVRAGPRTREWFGRKVQPWLLQEIDDLLERGTRCASKATSRVCRALRAIESSLWTFASRPGIEPTNNAAERAVRHAACWRKTSFGTASEAGSRFVERILTVVATCRSQGRSVMDFLQQAITSDREKSPNPSILPVGA